MPRTSRRVVASRMSIHPATQLSDNLLVSSSNSAERVAATSGASPRCSPLSRRCLRQRRSMHLFCVASADLTFDSSHLGYLGVAFA